MISSVYSYYLAQYGHKTNSKYDTHTKAQLKNCEQPVPMLTASWGSTTFEITFNAQNRPFKQKRATIRYPFVG